MLGIAQHGPAEIGRYYYTVLCATTVAVPGTAKGIVKKFQF